MGNCDNCMRREKQSDIDCQNMQQDILNRSKQSIQQEKLLKYQDQTKLNKSDIIINDKKSKPKILKEQLDTSNDMSFNEQHFHESVQNRNNKNAIYYNPNQRVVKSPQDKNNNYQNLINISNFSINIIDQTNQISQEGGGYFKQNLASSNVNNLNKVRSNHSFEDRDLTQQSFDYTEQSEQNSIMRQNERQAYMVFQQKNIVYEDKHPILKSASHKKAKEMESRNNKQVKTQEEPYTEYYGNIDYMKVNQIKMQDYTSSEGGTSSQMKQFSGKKAKILNNYLESDISYDMYQQQYENSLDQDQFDYPDDDSDSNYLRKKQQLSRPIYNDQNKLSKIKEDQNELYGSGLKQINW